MLLDSIPGVAKVVDTNEPMVVLWSKYGKWESEGSQMFTTGQVQRQDGPDLRASAGINVPELCTLLRLSTEGFSQFFLDISHILVRDDYLKALSDICYFSAWQKFPEASHPPAEVPLNPFLGGIQSVPCAVTLFGHPGIGKSVWLILVLVLRILAGFPTIYQHRPGLFLIFNSNGIYEVEPGSFSFVRAGPRFYEAITSHYWCLVDCNSNLLDVPLVLSTTRAFILQAASPRHQHLDWVKKYEAFAVTYYMKNWSLPELIMGRTLQPARNQRSEKELEEFYLHYAPSTRMAYIYAGNLPSYDRLVQREVAKLSFDSLGKVLSNAETMQDESASHHILLVGPAENRVEPSITIPTQHIYTKLHDQLGINTVEQAARLYQIFMRKKYTKSAAGYILDDIHSSFCEGGHWKLAVMNQGRMGGRNVHFRSPGPQPVTIHMHLGYEGKALTINDRLMGGNPTPLTHHTFHSNQDIVVEDGYYQPPPGQATFDGLIYDEATKTATLLQMTVGTKHDFKCGGIEWLKSQVVGNIRLVVVKPPSALDLAVPINVVPWINQGVYELVFDSLPG